MSREPLPEDPATRAYVDEQSHEGRVVRFIGRDCEDIHVYEMDSGYLMLAQRVPGLAHDSGERYDYEQHFLVTAPELRALGRMVRGL